MATVPTIRLWLDQQTTPPAIEINGERYPVEAFSIRFAYEFGQPYMGELVFAMDHTQFLDEVIILCEGLQWRGFVFKPTQYHMTGMGRYSQEVTIQFVGPPIRVSMIAEKGI